MAAAIGDPAAFPPCRALFLQWPPVGAGLFSSGGQFAGAALCPVGDVRCYRRRRPRAARNPRPADRESHLSFPCAITSLEGSRRSAPLPFGPEAPLLS